MRSIRMVICRGNELHKTGFILQVHANSFLLITHRRNVEVLAVAKMEMLVIWTMTPCDSCDDTKVSDKLTVSLGLWQLSQ
jgi:hypothetical protein